MLLNSCFYRTLLLTALRIGRVKDWTAFISGSQGSTLTVHFRDDQPLAEIDASAGSGHGSKVRVYPP